MLLFFRTKMQPTHFWKKHWTQNKPWIVIGCLLRLYLKWSFLHFHHIKKKHILKLKVVSHHRISEWTSNIDCYVRVCDVVRIIHSCKLSCLCQSRFVGAPSSTKFQDLSSNTTKSLPSSDSSTKYTTNKSLVSLISVYFKLGIPRISVHLITVGLVAPVGIPRILGMDA